jgi:hypothetical protein
MFMYNPASVCLKNGYTRRSDPDLQGHQIIEGATILYIGSLFACFRLCLAQNFLASPRVLNLLLEVLLY